MARKKIALKSKDTRRRYTDEFKEEAVQMLLDGHTAPSVMTRLAGIPLVDESTGILDDAAIRYATIYRFKGLEADCVILSGFARNKSGATQSELYCAASRAKLMLFCTLTGLIAKISIL